jgi:hypothetical protein
VASIHPSYGLSPYCGAPPAPEALPLYAPRALTTGPWGLTALADQQLAGVIMWIPAGLVLTAGVVAGLGVTMRQAERRPAVPGHTAVEP